MNNFKVAIGGFHIKIKNEVIIDQDHTCKTYKGALNSMVIDLSIPPKEGFQKSHPSMYESMCNVHMYKCRYI